MILRVLERYVCVCYVCWLGCVCCYALHTFAVTFAHLFDFVVTLHTRLLVYVYFAVLIYVRFVTLTLHVYTHRCGLHAFYILHLRATVTPHCSSHLRSRTRLRSATRTFARCHHVHTFTTLRYGYALRLRCCRLLRGFGYDLRLLLRLRWLRSVTRSCRLLLIYGWLLPVVVAVTFYGYAHAFGYHVYVCPTFLASFALDSPVGGLPVTVTYGSVWLRSAVPCVPLRLFPFYTFDLHTLRSVWLRVLFPVTRSPHMHYVCGYCLQFWLDCGSCCVRYLLYAFCGCCLIWTFRLRLICGFLRFTFPLRLHWVTHGCYGSRTRLRTFTTHLRLPHVRLFTDYARLRIYIAVCYVYPLFGCSRTLPPGYVCGYTPSTPHIR